MSDCELGVIFDLFRIIVSLVFVYSTHTKKFYFMSGLLSSAVAMVMACTESRGRHQVDVSAVGVCRIVLVSN